MRLNHPQAEDVLRLYMLLHADHEGGNVSAHLAHLVASAHSDLFFSYAAALCGLAGPLHGLANEESLKFQLNLQRRLEKDDVKMTKTPHDVIIGRIKDFCAKEIQGGRVIPGFGHAVLRTTDPRYSLLRAWGEKYGQTSDVIR